MNEITVDSLNKTFSSTSLHSKVPSQVKPTEKIERGSMSDAYIRLEGLTALSVVQKNAKLVVWAIKTWDLISHNRNLKLTWVTEVW